MPLLLSFLRVPVSRVSALLVATALLSVVPSALALSKRDEARVQALQTRMGAAEKAATATPRC